MTTESVKPVIAVKRFFDLDATRKITAPEFMEFWKVCSVEEKQQFAVSPAKQLGLLLDLTI